MDTGDDLRRLVEALDERPAACGARDPRGAPAAQGDGLSLSVFPLAPLPEVRPGDDLAGLVAAAAPADLADDDVLVIAHKAISKAEGRVRLLADVNPGDRARAFADAHGKDPRVVQAVLDETVELLRSERGVLVCVTRHGFVCANAGVDRSNVPDEDSVVLLPEDPDRLRAPAACRGGGGPWRAARPCS